MKAVPFLALFVICFLIIDHLPGTAAGSIAFVVLIAAWWSVLTRRRREKAVRRRAQRLGRRG